MQTHTHEVTPARRLTPTTSRILWTSRVREAEPAVNEEGVRILIGRSSVVTRIVNPLHAPSAGSAPHRPSDYTQSRPSVRLATHGARARGMVRRGEPRCSGGAPPAAFASRPETLTLAPCLPAQILCCVCAIPIAPNAVNMSRSACRRGTTSARAYPPSRSSRTCRGCGRYERRDGSFAPVEPSRRADGAAAEEAARAGVGAPGGCELHGPSPTPAASRSRHACRRRSSRAR